MPASTRFAAATHMLAALALARGTAVSSEALARSVHTNPAFVRRLFGALARAGLTTPRMGKGGGALLARPAEEITLLAVYRAVEQPAPLLPLHEPNPRCPVGKLIAPILEPDFASATRALERELATVTIADVARRIAARVGPAELDRLLDS